MSTLPMIRRSAIESADQCLYRYKAIWIDGVNDQSDYAMRGIAFHAAAHQYILRLVEKRIPADLEEAHQAFLDGVGTTAIPGRLIQEVRTLFDRWSEHFALDLEAFAGAEERQETPDQVFTPDLVYARPHELEIRDFKTFYVALTETQARQDWQARFYIRNAMLKWPNFPSYRFTYDFVRLGKTLTLTFSPDELQALERDVAAVLAMVKHATEVDEWPATPGPACTYCELKCPVVDQALVVPKRFTGLQQAQAMGSWILAAEQVVRNAKKALKAYSVVNGPVDIGGVEWANRPVLERKYPVDVLMQVLTSRNIMGAFDNAQSDGLTISHSALSKLFKQYPMLEQDLAPHVQQKTSYRFGAKKPGGSEDDVDE